MAETNAETDALADHLRMTVPALSASLAERLAEGLRPFLAEVWDDGAIARAEADPWASVRHLNPYRPQVEVDLSAWTPEAQGECR